MSRPWGPGGPRTDRGRLALVLALATAVAVFTATVPLLRDWFDLRVYYGTVDTWMWHGGHIYDYRVPGTDYGFTYPPFAALAMLPMALVGWHTAVGCALLLNLGTLAVAVRLLYGRELARHGWFGWALAGCALALFEPVRDTFSFGQVNLVLLALVLVDIRLLNSGRGRWAGAGIGLAAAVKLTPALFIGMLLLARRWRAAAVATAVAGAATALAAWAAPGASRFYWTRAVWDTTRVGRLDYVSNQSVQGVLARLAADGQPARPVWALAVLAVLAVWAVRTRGAVRAGDWRAAVALTGAAACLVSPVTWVHHLVWLLPSFAVLLHHRRVRSAAALYVVLCSSVVWLWIDDASGLDGFLGGNAYTWITLGLLIGLPVGLPVGLSGSLPLGQLRTERRSLKRTASAAAPAPTAPATAVPDQPESSPASLGLATGSAAGPGCATGRGGSSEPTGSTRPAAANPQSSSSRASSYTAKPPPN